MKSAFLLTLVVFASGCAVTQPASTRMNLAEELNKYENLGAFLEHVRDIRSGFEDGSRGELAPRHMALLVESHETLERLLSGVDSVDELHLDDRIAVYNAQGAVNAIELGNPEDRPICRSKVRQLGSRMMKTECYTAAQRERMRHAAEGNLNYIRVLQSSRVGPPGPGR